MKRVWLGAAAVVLLANGTVRAQMVVTDPLVEANTLQSLVKEVVAAGKRVEIINNQISQLIQLRNTFAAVSHGNLAALGDLVPELGVLGLTSPFGEDMGAVLQALGGTAATLGATGALTQDLLRTDQFYAPRAADFRAVMLNQTASAVATQKALAELAMKSSGERIAHLTALRNSLSSTSDVKAAADATARLAGEQATAQAQGNQLLALQVLQRSQAATTEAREQQAWRCSAETLVAQARAAAASADSGMVVLVSSSSSTASCAASGTAPGTYVPTNNTGTLTASSTPDDGTTLGKMLAQSWGQTAAHNATALGVNPTALAATCALESNCSANVGGAGTISGAFQMSNGTYAETVAAVQASNPDLASQITTKNDPASQSIAAAQYLKQGAQALEAADIANPTVLDVRGYYNFGPAYAARVAAASDNQLMSDTLAGMSSTTLRANGISDSTTVGQWRQGVINKIGAAASQPVLTGGTRT